jgi:hypothetical protein
LGKKNKYEGILGMQDGEDWLDIVRSKMVWITESKKRRMAAEKSM